MDVNVAMRYMLRSASTSNLDSCNIPCVQDYFNQVIWRSNTLNIPANKRSYFNTLEVNDLLKFFLHLEFKPRIYANDNRNFLQLLSLFV